MSTIDQYAYSNRLRAVDPAYKAGLALLVLLVCLAANRPLVGLLAAAWMFVLATVVAKLPGRIIARLLLAELFFLMLASIGIALSIQTTAVAGALRLGPLYITSNPKMFGMAVDAVFRALGATAALNFLALTTPLADLVNLLRRLRTPVLLIDLMTVTYRFIFILFETYERIYTAQCCRLGYSSPGRSFVSAGRLGSRLFIDAYRRSQRLQIALDARGFDGELRVLPRPYTGNRTLFWSGTATLASLVIVRVLS